MIAQLQARQQRNLSFLRRTDNVLYDRIVNYKMRKSKLDVRVEEGEFDLLVGGRSLYHQKAKAYAAKRATALFRVRYPQAGDHHAAPVSW